MNNTKPASVQVRERARSRPSGSERRARDQLVNIRINADERARWTAFAESHGMALAGLLRVSVETVIRQEEAFHVR